MSCLAFHLWDPVRFSEKFSGVFVSLLKLKLLNHLHFSFGSCNSIENISGDPDVSLSSGLVHWIRVLVIRVSVQIITSELGETEQEIKRDKRGIVELRTYMYRGIAWQ